MPTKLATLAASVNKTQRRRLRGLKLTVDRFSATAKVYSLTGEGHEVEHQCSLVFVTGATNCSCPDFKFRCRKRGLACKHIIRLAAALERKLKKETTT